MAEGIKVGIMPSEFPSQSLTTEQLEAVKELILDKILEHQREKSEKPNFLSAQNRPGWLALMCADKATLQWLKTHIGEIHPWEGATLRLVEGEEIPHTELFTTYLHGSKEYSTNKILGLIEAQNSLHTSSWRVINRSTSGAVEILTLSVDSQSAERLRTMGYTINYRYGRTVIRKKSGRNEATTSGSEKPTTSGSQKPATSGSQKPGTSGSQKPATISKAPDEQESAQATSTEGNESLEQIQAESRRTGNQRPDSKESAVDKKSGKPDKDKGN
ncbi:uncharacterized protein LOC126888705 [Diabrotica virgifera virgifera]|uniref:DUF4780 domain-containing protein n=2 Tax=Diabrotica virgifera virgifera TaxID=50390 RepID=A0ABM5KS71_DIAVI|nr:uncharacterized protein LOC126888705 [Diabrotica virgifera virgifera]